MNARRSEIDGTSPSTPGAFAFEDITNQIINTELLLTQSRESTQQRSGEYSVQSSVSNQWCGSGLFTVTSVPLRLFKDS